MKKKLRILFVEDNPYDLEIIWKELEKNDIAFEKIIVETRDEYVGALTSFNPDIVLSDYSLPQFDGLTALKIRNEQNPMLPFILVTGSVNETTAVELMREGADDYVIKRNMSRLGQAIIGAIEKKENLKKKEIAEMLVRESEEQFRKAVTEAPVPIMIHDEDGKVILLSKGWTNYSGYTIDDIPTMDDWTEAAYGQRTGQKKDYIDDLFRINQTMDNGEWVIKTKSGEERIWEFHTTPLGRVNDGKRVLHSLAIDITEQKKNEAELKMKIEELEKFNDLTVDRELKMVDLKKEINRLLIELGKKEKYKIVE